MSAISLSEGFNTSGLSRLSSVAILALTRSTTGKYTRGLALQTAQMGERLAVPVNKLGDVRCNPRQGALVLACVFVPAGDDVLDAVFVGVDADRGFRAAAHADQLFQVAQPLQLVDERAQIAVALAEFGGACEYALGCRRSRGPLSFAATLAPLL